MNAHGITQARALASALAGEPFGLIVTSDLKRAAQTAQAIARDRPVRVDPRWRECSFGEWEGQPVAGRVAARSYEPPGGETFENLRTRVEAALDDLRLEHAGNVLAVTHAGPLHAALDILFGGIDVVFMPASITRIDLLGKRARLISLNETVAPGG